MKGERHRVPPTGGETARPGYRVHPFPESPTSENNQVTACAHYVRSGEHGAERRAGNLETFSEIGVSRSGSVRRRKKREVPVPRETMGIFPPE
jgi:hypothetical protein